MAPQFSVLADLRADLRRWLDRDGIEGEVVDDLVLVATELATNAIEATEDDGDVWLSLVDDGGSIRLAVVNSQAEGGPPAGEPPELRAGSLQERGRGLAIVRALVDTLSMTSAEGHTEVCIVRFLT